MAGQRTRFFGWCEQSKPSAHAKISHAGSLTGQRNLGRVTHQVELGTAGTGRHGSRTGRGTGARHGERYGDRQRHLAYRRVSTGFTSASRRPQVAKCIDGPGRINKRHRRRVQRSGEDDTPEPQPARRWRRAALGTWARIGHRPPYETGYSRRQPENRERHPIGFKPDGVAFFVLTFWSPVTESNRRPSPYHGKQGRLMTSSNLS